LAIAALGATLGIAASQGPSETAKKTKLRVGAFDSRAVAVAFYASEFFRKEATQWHEAVKKAKAEGDEDEAKKIEAKARARQRLAHLQGFGTEPVDDLLKPIKSKLPEIAKKANVDIIVSKWSVTYRAEDAELVDVTDLMVEPYKPNARARKSIEAVRKKPPISREEIEQHED
jgi:hypothetical protein